MLSLPLPMLDALPLGAHRLLMLTDPALEEANGVRVAFSGRDGGVSEGCYASLNLSECVGDDSASVAENYARVTDAVGASASRTILLRQVHGTNVVVVGQGGQGGFDEAAVREAQEGADAVVADCHDIAAMLISADCLCAAIVSPTGRYALFHAGWRGALAGIAAKAARTLAQVDEAPLSACNAYIGPHIRSECFEVDLDLATRFERAFPGSKVGERNVDLSYIVTRGLLEAGLRSERILDARVCTKCNSDRYYSYRASGGMCGRHGMIAYRP